MCTLDIDIPGRPFWSAPLLTWKWNAVHGGGREHPERPALAANAAGISRPPSGRDREELECARANVPTQRLKTATLAWMVYDLAMGQKPVPPMNIPIPTKID